MNTAMLVGAFEGPMGEKGYLYRLDRDIDEHGFIAILEQSGVLGTCEAVFTNEDADIPLIPETIEKALSKEDVEILLREKHNLLLEE